MDGRRGKVRVMGRRKKRFARRKLEMIFPAHHAFLLFPLHRVVPAPPQLGSSRCGPRRGRAWRRVSGTAGHTGHTCTRVYGIPTASG